VLGPGNRIISDAQTAMLQHPKPYHRDHGVGREGRVHWVLQHELLGEGSVRSSSDYPTKWFFDHHLVLMRKESLI
jgi:hypothetical protein